MLSFRNIAVLTFLLVLFLGCDTEQPGLSEIRGFIDTSPDKVYSHGDFLILEGSFYNGQGLKEIEIINEPLGIYFKRDLGGESTYDLYFEHEIPYLPIPEVHEVSITVKALNSQVRTFSYPVDYVFLPKIINMRFSVDPDDDTKRTFHGRVEDYYGIKTIKLHSLRIGKLVDLQFPQHVHDFDLNENFWFPPATNFGEYPLTLQITNHRGLNLTITDFEGILDN